MVHTKYGMKAVDLILIGEFISFVGMFALLLPLPILASFEWGFYQPLLISSISIFDVVLLIFIKSLISMVIPFIGMKILITSHKKAAAIILFVSGFLTVIPIYTGNYTLFFLIITLFGIGPFLPHIISGIIFIIAGILALY